MQVLKLAAWAFVTIALLVFFAALAGQNQEPTVIKLFQYTSAEHPMWVLVAFTFFSGAIFASLFFILQLLVLETRYLRLRRSFKQLERALDATKQQTGPAASLGLDTKQREPAIKSLDDV